jgi:hypothetical protein
MHRAIIRNRVYRLVEERCSLKVRRHEALAGHVLGDSANAAFEIAERGTQ